LGVDIYKTNLFERWKTTFGYFIFYILLTIFLTILKLLCYI